MGILIKLNNQTIAEVAHGQSMDAMQQIVCEKLVRIMEIHLIPRFIDFYPPPPIQNVRPEEFYFTHNGRKVTPHNTDELDLEASIQTIFRLLGGKGGFGSMLRAIGAQIEKTTNRDACRDLSGRRLRDINEEKRLKAWLEKQPDRESDQYAKKKKKLERLQTKPRHDFKDEDYEQARSELTANVGEAVDEGFKKAQAIEAAGASGQKQKRKNQEEEKEGQKKKKLKKKKSSNLWIAADLSSGSDEDDDTESDEEEDKDAQKKKKPLETKEESNSSVEK